jgi:hypothetical protein
LADNEGVWADDEILMTKGVAKMNKFLMWLYVQDGCVDRRKRVIGKNSRAFI